ncbi:glycosyl hydrolase family 18 protein [Clostridium paraputrificum]|uniref:glycosyl hydrolase family 18 protein n=1 Tax=Clostridium paraputrificum TaxID=29363 RepID=UPI00325BC5F0
MTRKCKKLVSIFAAVLLFVSIIPIKSVSAAQSLGERLLVGYWHNFDNGTGIINLRNVSDKWDVINVAFGETYSDRAVVEFTPCYDEEQFISDVQYIKSKGKKVILSIGGQNGVVLLPDATAKEKFVKSICGLVDKYGFDGLDIDLESGISLQASDTDFKNPKTPQIVNLILGVREISDKYGSNFIISMAPETAYVQGGITAYGNIWGAYLPIIYGLRDKLTYIHVQHYNAGGNQGLDGVTYTQGTADYEVAMAEMLLYGFPIAGNSNNMFPALREDQVMIGLPATQAAAPSGGYINPTEMKKALDYLIKGVSYGGSYKLANGKGYPAFRGLMTWSINWDAKNNFEFSNNYRDYFDKLTPVQNTLKAATLSVSSVNNGSYTLTAKVPSRNTATSYKILEGTMEIATGTLTAGNSKDTTITKSLSNKENGQYEYTVVLSDGTNSVTSNKVVVKVEPQPELTLKAATLSASVVNNGNYTLLAIVPEYNKATSYKIFEGSTEVASGTLIAGNSEQVTLTKKITNKEVGSYDYTIVLYEGLNSVISNKVTVVVENYTPEVKTWAAYVAYKNGDIVSYNESNYVCRQAHTSLPGWEPANVAALWQKQ